MEEEDDVNNETLDPSLQKKHNEIIERLSARHQSRKPNPFSSSSSTLESTSSFLTKFTDSKQSIESKISQTRLSLPPDPKSNLTEISSQIESLEKLLAENSYFLPSYQVRSSLKSITDLKQTLDHLSSELIPKKKFSFKNKPISKKPHFIPISKHDVVLPPEKLHVPAVRDSPGFRNLKGETLVKDLSFGEFTLSDLDSCQVRLKGNVNALFVNKLRNCKVYTGPVIGSVLIDDVEDCVLVLASHQIRIHCAKRCDFYLRVRSRPIIEDSNCVRFAPYCLRYDGIEEDLNKAGLEEENESWCNVDDFLWLRAVQSPNWSILPEDERVLILQGFSGFNVETVEDKIASK